MGCGAFGVVTKGVATGILSDGEETTVAVKGLRGTARVEVSHLAVSIVLLALLTFQSLLYIDSKITEPTFEFYNSYACVLNFRK